MKITVSEALNALHAHEDQRFLELFRHGSMSVEIYEPVGHDPQQPHAQDEIYIILQGNGIFQNGQDKYPFTTGDFLFVPAGVEHRFLEFTDDFKTWVKETAETQYWLELLWKTQYLTLLEYNSLLSDSTEIMKLLSSSILTKKKKLAAKTTAHPLLLLTLTSIFL